MGKEKRVLLNGNEAVAHAARELGIQMGAGYPGTPSTEILETFSAIGGPARWSPNEKVAFEVALGTAFGNGRALVTMKHVGLNVAADPLFTAAYTGVSGALVVVVADDPGMASSQNEQDSRYYAIASGIPMLEPSDSQEAYEYFAAAINISERWGTPVLLRLTTRVSHTKSVVHLNSFEPLSHEPRFERDRQSRVMIPSYARLAHRRLRVRLSAIREWNETSRLNTVVDGNGDLGIITSGVAAKHVMEAAPKAHVLKLGLIHPLPIETIRRFVNNVEHCIVIEEGDCVLADACRAAGIAVEGKPEVFRFGELDVGKVRRILSGDTTAEQSSPKGTPPRYCRGCSYRTVFQAFHDLDCIVTGDIGCYTLGVLPPFEAMDTCVCMGASISVGLGLRHILPPDQAQRVVSVIGDSTFIHSGIQGLVELVYNPPETGHVVVILDNDTTAMTGLQEHPGTGRTLDHKPTGKIVFEELVRTLGIKDVSIIDPLESNGSFERLLRESLESRKPCVIIARRPCLLAAKHVRAYESQKSDTHETGK